MRETERLRQREREAERERERENYGSRRKDCATIKATRLVSSEVVQFFDG